MATCPKCGASSRTDPTFEVTRELVAQPLGTHSLSGAQMKVSARSVHVLRHVGPVGQPCGWSVTGRVVGDEFVADRQGGVVETVTEPLAAYRAVARVWSDELVLMPGGASTHWRLADVVDSPAGVDVRSWALRVMAAQRLAWPDALEIVVEVVDGVSGMPVAVEIYCPVPVDTAWIAGQWGVTPKAVQAYLSRGEGVRVPVPDVMRRPPRWSRWVVTQFVRPGRGARTDLRGGVCTP